MSQDQFSREQVVEIIESVMHKMSGGGLSQDRVVLDELRTLHNLVDTFRSELGAVYPGDIRHDHIPNATDELDAVIAMTEEATHTIMSACDNIQALFPTMNDDVTTKVGSEIISIIEACTFQDLTSQRITKVMKFLKDIDHKTESLLGIMKQRFGFEVQVSEKTVVANDASLMNGPQLPGQGITQDEIDKLLNSFG